jgi:hypothetical protein
MAEVRALGLVRGAVLRIERIDLTISRDDVLERRYYERVLLGPLSGCRGFANSSEPRSIFSMSLSVHSHAAARASGMPSASLVRRSRQSETRLWGALFDIGRAAFGAQSACTTMFPTPAHAARANAAPQASSCGSRMSGQSVSAQSRNLYRTGTRSARIALATAARPRKRGCPETFLRCPWRRSLTRGRCGTSLPALEHPRGFIPSPGGKTRSCHSRVAREPRQIAR